MVEGAEFVADGFDILLHYVAKGEDGEFDVRSGGGGGAPGGGVVGFVEVVDDDHTRADGREGLGGEGVGEFVVLLEGFAEDEIAVGGMYDALGIGRVGVEDGLPGAGGEFEAEGGGLLILGEGGCDVESGDAVAGVIVGGSAVGACDEGSHGGGELVGVSDFEGEFSFDGVGAAA